MPLKMVVWDVAHGSATYLRTPNGKHIVIDLGAKRSSDDAFSPLQHLKQIWGISRLDLVVVTHPHLDHIEDILNFDSLDPVYLQRPSHLTEADIKGGNSYNSDDAERIIDKYIEIDNRYTGRYDPNTSPRKPSNNGNVKIESWTPSQSSTSNLNNHSVVTLITFEGVKILVPGDNESPSWNELLQKDDFVQSIQNVHVLVAPHHGREAGFHKELFDNFSPKLTIISDSKFLDTSATQRYGEVTQGWTVHRRNGPDQTRKCVTTRNDGVIDVEVGRGQNASPYLSVTID